MSQPDISIIIVNYNVEHFLSLCLESVFASKGQIDLEVIVVDNHSSDHSVEMVKRDFPQCRLLVNQENLGFSKANNLGIYQSSGKYVLLLNPDTILAEDSLEKAFTYLEANSIVGGLGLRMVDGSGKFLPESRRGMPTPWVSFCKAFGLSRLFPNSPLFGRYYQSYLPENQTHETDILSGASMIIRREVLDKAGLLDESFFMYGEDVDLSYRIQLEGFSNIYFPETTIIHFKGESTRRGSLSFVFHFYKSMLLFSRKHFTKHSAFRIFILCGVAIRASLALINHFFRQFGDLLIEFCIAYVGMVYIKNWWELNFKGIPGMYPDAFIEMLVPGYIIIWLVSSRLVGRFSESYSYGSILQGIALGTFIISGITNFFDDYRFSKGLILIGAVWTYLVVTFRLVLARWLFHGTHKLKMPRRKRLLIVGNQSDFEACQKLLVNFEKRLVLCGWVASDEMEKENPYFLGQLKDLENIIHRIGVDELVIGLKSISRKRTMELIEQFRNKYILFSFLSENKSFIIASTEKHNRGTIYQEDNIPKILLPYNLRLKRLADLVGCFILLAIFPIAILQGASPGLLLSNWFQVISGNKSWIGLANNHLQSFGLKNGVVTLKNLAGPGAESSLLEAMDRIYAQEFHPMEDIWNLLKNLKFTGK